MTSTLPIQDPLPPVLRDALASGKVIDRDGTQHPLHSNISHEEALLLYAAVRQSKPVACAEVGFANGVSAISILQALSDNEMGNHHIMDPFQADYHDLGLEMVARAGLSARMTFYRQFAEEVAPGLPRLQFAFIDASHLFDLTLVEFVLMDKKLDVGGMIAFHDLWMPSLQKLIRYILANRSYEIVRDFDTPQPPPRLSSRRKLKSALIGIARALPGSERIFGEEFLRPWWTLQIPNLVILRKSADDCRDWRYHAPF